MIYRQMVIHIDNSSLVFLLSCELSQDRALTSNTSIPLFISSMPEYEESDLTRKPWSPWKVALLTRAQNFMLSQVPVISITPWASIVSCTPLVRSFHTGATEVDFQELPMILLLLFVHTVCEGRHTCPHSMHVEVWDNSVRSTLSVHLNLGTQLRWSALTQWKPQSGLNKRIGLGISFFPFLFGEVTRVRGWTWKN